MSLTLLALVTLAVACSGGGGSDGGMSLSTGTYTLSASAMPVNACGFASSYYIDDDTVDVTVIGDVIDMEFAGFHVDYVLTGTLLVDTSGTAAQLFDFNVLAVASANGFSRTYDCVHTRDRTFTGEVIAKNTFTLDDTYEHSNAGAECTAVVASNALAAACVSTLVTTATR